MHLFRFQREFEYSITVTSHPAARPDRPPTRPSARTKPRPWRDKLTDGSLYYIDTVWRQRRARWLSPLRKLHVTLHSCSSYL